jgi:hypothetical protein
MLRTIVRGFCISGEAERPAPVQGKVRLLVSRECECEIGQRAINIYSRIIRSEQISDRSQESRGCSSFQFTQRYRHLDPTG